MHNIFRNPRQDVEGELNQQSTNPSRGIIQIFAYVLPNTPLTAPR
jgi:hypothetical protein